MLQLGERINFEVKQAGNCVPKSVWETYSAFANTQGGYIVLGIKENVEAKSKSERYEIQGVENPDKIIKDIWNTINSNTVSANILREKDVEVIQAKGKLLVCIYVPQAGYRQRPIYKGDNMMRGTFKRNHEGDYHCIEAEVKSMIRDSNDNGCDGILMEHYDMEDIDDKALHSYRTIFERQHPTHTFNTYDDKEFLRQMECYTKNRDTGEEGLTLAGLLMFGKGLSIKERVDNFRMDYLDKTHLIGDMRWSDRITYDGSWENNLFNFFWLVLPKLMVDMKTPFKLKGIERIDDTPVHKAIREAFTNAIIHADYLTTGILKVEKHDDSLVFSNPGRLRLPIERIYEGFHSKSRNPRIQNLLRMIGFGENIGSGFPTILQVCKEENWRRPDLHEELDLDLVELKLWTISVLSQEEENKFNKQFGPILNTLSAEEQAALTIAFTEKLITNKRLQTILKKSSSDISLILAHLQKVGALDSNHKGRWTTYRIASPIPIEPMLSFQDGTVNGTVNGTENGLYRENETIRLNKNQYSVLKYIAINEHSTYEDVAQKLQISRRTISRHISILRQLGVVVRKGSDKNGYWKVLKPEMLNKK